MSPAKNTFKEQLNILTEIASRRSVNYHYLGGEGQFDSLSEEQQVLAISGLSKYTEMLQGFETKGLDFHNSQHLLGAALEKMNLFLPDHLLYKILPTDFVEVYSLNMIPLFKSVNFWGTSSYPLDLLYSASYDTLFERSEFHQAALNRAAAKVMTGQKSIIERPVPSHVAWEKQGSMSCQVSYKYLASVYDAAGVIVGAICVSEITPLSQ